MFDGQHKRLVAFLLFGVILCLHLAAASGTEDEQVGLRAAAKTRSSPVSRAARLTTRRRTTKRYAGLQFNGGAGRVASGSNTPPPPADMDAQASPASKLQGLLNILNILNPSGAPKPAAAAPAAVPALSGAHLPQLLNLLQALHPAAAATTVAPGGPLAKLLAAMHGEAAAGSVS
ncbi:hypothetical protein RvY_16041-1 [Ramazzottius varieornatus]|uniref:Uncharacterized protein n=1 Tax=Ramazzottius varieornatus TaxID=947166 RepID=A0A1D1W1L4_RAMVA|nr:hypothetical protein RvY_16041-1 [Ramazzottius varieornatus]